LDIHDEWIETYLLLINFRVRVKELAEFSEILKIISAAGCTVVYFVLG